MQRRKRQEPSYRQRKGYDQAIVTLDDRPADIAQVSVGEILNAATETAWLASAKIVPSSG